MNGTAKTMVSLDGLSDFVLRDPSRLTVGSAVLFGHVPIIDDPSLAFGRVHPQGFFARVTGVELKTFIELHPHAHGTSEDEPKLVIFYEAMDGHRGYRYASDSGVIPYYGVDGYNSTNFVVLLEDLEAQDVISLLTVSEGYAAELEAYNAKAAVYDYPEYDYID